MNFEVLDLLLVPFFLTVLCTLLLLPYYYRDFFFIFKESNMVSRAMCFISLKTRSGRSLMKIKTSELNQFTFCVCIAHPLTDIQLRRVQQILLHSSVFLRKARIPAFTSKSKPYLVEQ